MFDEDNILEEHESPSDTPTKWQYMVEHNYLQTEIVRCEFAIQII